MAGLGTASSAPITMPTLSEVVPPLQQQRRVDLKALFIDSTRSDVPTQALRIMAGKHLPSTEVVQELIKQRVSESETQQRLLQRTQSARNLIENQTLPNDPTGQLQVEIIRYVLNDAQIGDLVRMQLFNHIPPVEMDKFLKEGGKPPGDITALLNALMQSPEFQVELGRQMTDAFPLAGGLNIEIARNIFGETADIVLKNRILKAKQTAE